MVKDDEKGQRCAGAVWRKPLQNVDVSKAGLTELAGRIYSDGLRGDYGFPTDRLTDNKHLRGSAQKCIVIALFQEKNSSARARHSFLFM